MVLDKCPHCGTRHVQTTQRSAEVLKPNSAITWHTVRCQNTKCHALILVEAVGQSVRSVYPVGTFDLDTEAPIPSEIRDDFREAGLCMGSGCFRASLVMSRRVLQRCLKAQGCNQRNLVDAIDHAVSTGILRKAFHALADEIRHYGNLGAHPDDDQLPNANRESAEQVLEFARLLIHEFYEVPATAVKLRQSRQDRQA
jgi:hypothetical protein